MEVDAFSTPVSHMHKKMQEICDILQMQVTDDATQTATKMADTVASILKTLNTGYVGSPILAKDEFRTDQLKTVEDIQSAMHDEYTYRYNVLKKRLNVTLQGFSWSEKGKENDANMQQVVAQQLQQFPSAPSVTLYDLFAAQPDVAVITKASVSTVSKASPIKSFVIGDVPDRGGRPHERLRGAMPVFKSRDQLGISEPQQKAQRTSGGRGRVQGAWHSDKGGKGSTGGKQDGGRQGGGWSAGGARGRGRGRGW